MKLTMNQAAKEAGKAKKTILEALKSGRLSGEKNGQGRWEIEPAELFRVFPKLVGDKEPVPKPTTHGKPETTQENNPLQAVVDAKKLVEQELRQQIDDLRSDRDEWRKQAQQLALAAPTEKATEAPQKAVGWFDRLLGRSG